MAAPKASASRASASSSRARAACSMLGCGGAAHVVGARVLDVDVQPAGEALAQVGMQMALEVAGELVRGADEDPHGQIVLQVGEGDLGRVAQVVGDVLVDRALVVGLRPAALVVAAAQLVLDELDLLERRRPGRRRAAPCGG